MQSIQSLIIATQLLQLSSFSNFNYLMCIGAGDSSISFSDECHEELTSFKTRIEAFKSMHDNNQNSNEKQVIEKLKFCKVDQDGQVKLE